MSILQQLLVLAQAKEMISDVYHAHIKDDTLSSLLSCANEIICEAEYAMEKMYEAEKKFNKFKTETLGNQK